MGNVTMQGVQKLLHLDVEYPNFQAWEEVLQFEVDGVAVKAIATHAWRGDSIKLAQPFEVEGDQYGYSCRPPLIALGAAMLGRQRSLAARGLTVRDDCIRMAKAAYREHAAYLRLLPEIEREQQAFVSVFREELDALSNEDALAQERFKAGRLALRRKLSDKEIEPKAYQEALESLKKQADLVHEKYFMLQSDVQRELQEIKAAHVKRALAIKSPPSLIHAND